MEELFLKLLLDGTVELEYETREGYMKAFTVAYWHTPSQRNYYGWGETLVEALEDCLKQIQGKQCDLNDNALVLDLTKGTLYTEMMVDRKK
jgi:hypothetical protein